MKEKKTKILILISLLIVCNIGLSFYILTELSSIKQEQIILKTQLAKIDKEQLKKTSLVFLENTPEITGAFNPEESKNLSVILKSGSIPVNMSVDGTFGTQDSPSKK